LINIIHAPRVNANEDETVVVMVSVAVGDQISAGDIVLELESTKAVTQVDAPKSGYVRRVDVAVNDRVQVGQELIIVSDSPDEAVAERPVSTPTEQTTSKSPVLTTKAKILARKLSLTIDDFQHLSGRITTEDVQRVAISSGSENLEQGESIEPLDPARYGMALTVQKSRAEAVPAYLEIILDLTELTTYSKMFQSHHAMLTDPLADVVAYAFTKCLDSNPLLNSVISGRDLRKCATVNLAFAVDSPQGLMMPIVREANKKTLIEFVHEMQTLRRHMFRNRRDGQLFENPTAGFTSMAAFGVLRHIPILLPGTSLMLAHSASTEAGEDKTNTVVGATYDHQLLSGADIGRMFENLRQIADDPEHLGTLPETP
jgi:pyruvate/2-oxoglutarate dehydrogenase complex dihydrolipoamide acyltransferase (E2) component